MSKIDTPKGVYRLNRRDFLKLGGAGLAAVGLSPLLNACSPSSTATPVAKIGGTIDFLSWEGYDLPGCMEAWNKANQVVFSSTYIGDHNEIQAKLSTASSVGYDLITYYQGYAEMYIDELKLLNSIDTSKVPNFANLFERFRTGDVWLKNGKIWGVPFTWGTEGCNYASDKIDPPQSWAELLTPKFKGVVGMVDNMIDSTINAACAMGFNDKLPNLTAQELEEVKGFLLKMKAQARAIGPSYGDLTDMLVSGEVVATFPGWAAMNVWAKARQVNVKMIVPSEGSYSFCDAFAIPVQSDNVETVLAWINEALSPEVQACQALNLSAAVVNPLAVPLLDEDTRAMYDYDHMDEWIKKAPFYKMPPLKSDQYTTYDQWIAMWDEVKAE
jgi:spermidine/putrescine transport system substrate-binding protein